MRGLFAHPTVAHIHAFNTGISKGAAALNYTSTHASEYTFAKDIGNALRYAPAESNVVEANGARFLWLGHDGSPVLRVTRQGYLSAFSNSRRPSNRPSLRGAVHRESLTRKPL